MHGTSLSIYFDDPINFEGNTICDFVHLSAMELIRFYLNISFDCEKTGLYVHVNIELIKMLNCG